MTSPSERYEILEVFGTPTEHAIVGRGRDLTTGIEYAVKMRRGEGNVERRFTREVEAMQAAAGPNVMSVIDVDPDGEWYTMPIAEGELTPAIKDLSLGKREELALAVVGPSDGPLPSNMLTRTPRRHEPTCTASAPSWDGS